MTGSLEIKTNKPFVSILTPVYNGEKYLSECIESVLNQTYENWEYVIVNNRSTDRSLEIAEQYASQDSRITVHTNNKHMPQMESLNQTFRFTNVESSYCKVVHADDWMFPECVARMVAHGEKHPNAGIINSYYLDQHTVRPQGLEYPTPILDGRDISRAYFLNSHTLFAAPSNLLIRSDLLFDRENAYDPDNIHSDHGFCLDIMRTHDFGFVHQVLTFSRRHEESHTNRVAEKFDTYTMGRLKNLKKHGRYFLTEQELDMLMNSMIDTIHRSISHKFLFGRSMGVINYKLRELNEMEIPLSRWKVCKGLAAEIFSLRRNFKGLLKRLS
jgi:glycosyltransferase involved in cell wall biosynthesis